VLLTHPWWWRQYVPLKRRSTIILHGSTSQKTIPNFILAAVRTWNLTYNSLLFASEHRHKMSTISPKDQLRSSHPGALLISDSAIWRIYFNLHLWKFWWIFYACPRWLNVTLLYCSLMKDGWETLDLTVYEYVRFQVVTAASMKLRIFWDVLPCS
jgi:hypothetical protein